MYSLEIKTGSTGVPFKLPTRILRQSNVKLVYVSVVSSSSVISDVPDLLSMTAVFVETVLMGVIPSPEFFLLIFLTGCPSCILKQTSFICSLQSRDHHE